MRPGEERRARSTTVPANGATRRPHGLTRADVMKPREVAELLDVPVSTVLERGRNGTLPRVKLGRHVRFIRAGVDATIQQSHG